MFFIYKSLQKFCTSYILKNFFLIVYIFNLRMHLEYFNGLMTVKGYDTANLSSRR